jgi:hypothetical protein
MRPSLRGRARVCERRRAKRAVGPDHVAPETPELAPPPSTRAAMRGNDRLSTNSSPYRRRRTGTPIRPVKAFYSIQKTPLINWPRFAHPVPM